MRKIEDIDILGFRWGVVECGGREIGGLTLGRCRMGAVSVQGRCFGMIVFIIGFKW